ncbi:MAG: Uma2 family endonuclease [Microcystaceae cyanobacterium]
MWGKARGGAKYLEKLLLDKAEVRFNGPITLLDSEPEPDIAIVRLPESIYRDRHPNADDIYWLIEVAQTSLRKDLATKTAIYAQAAIAEYWILNISMQEVIVFRNPQENKYLEKFKITDGSISPLAFPKIFVEVKKLL